MEQTISVIERHFRVLWVLENSEHLGWGGFPVDTAGRTGLFLCIRMREEGEKEAVQPAWRVSERAVKIRLTG